MSDQNGRPRTPDICGPQPAGQAASRCRQSIFRLSRMISGMCQMEPPISGAFCKDSRQCSARETPNCFCEYLLRGDTNRYRMICAPPTTRPANVPLSAGSHKHEQWPLELGPPRKRPPIRQSIGTNSAKGPAPATCKGASVAEAAP